jgi:hypothetical protein
MDIEFTGLQPLDYPVRNPKSIEVLSKIIRVELTMSERKIFNLVENLDNPKELLMACNLPCNMESEKQMDLTISQVSESM